MFASLQVLRLRVLLVAGLIAVIRWGRGCAGLGVFHRGAFAPGKGSTWAGDFLCGMFLPCTA
jgi:hypothetical protein